MMLWSKNKEIFVKLENLEIKSQEGRFSRTEFVIFQNKGEISYELACYNSKQRAMEVLADCVRKFKNQNRDMYRGEDVFEFPVE